MRTRLFAGALAVLFGAGPTGIIAADQAPYQSLIDNSPFLTPAFKARLGKRDTLAMSFVGYTCIGKDWLFVLIDKKSGKALWLPLNTEKDGITIESFDEKNQMIQLSVGGLGVELALEKEK